MRLISVNSVQYSESRPQKPRENTRTIHSSAAKAVKPYRGTAPHQRPATSKIHINHTRISHNEETRLDHITAESDRATLILVSMHFDAFTSQNLPRGLSRPARTRVPDVSGRSTVSSCLTMREKDVHAGLRLLWLFDRCVRSRTGALLFASGAIKPYVVAPGAGSPGAMSRRRHPHSGLSSPSARGC